MNRASARTQSALLEAMEEGQVTVDDKTYALPKPFVVIATQNPSGASGTSLLPDSQMDRFFIRVSMGYPSQDNEIEMLEEELATGAYDGPYLTTNDGLLEFNLDNTYKIYENLSVSLDLGYIVNMMDRGTWARSWTKNPGNERSFSKHDAWKAQMTFAYTF